MGGEVRFNLPAAHTVITYFLWLPRSIRLTHSPAASISESEPKFTFEILPEGAVGNHADRPTLSSSHKKPYDLSAAVERLTALCPCSYASPHCHGRYDRQRLLHRHWGWLLWELVGGDIGCKSSAITAPPKVIKRRKNDGRPAVVIPHLIPLDALSSIPLVFAGLTRPG